MHNKAYFFIGISALIHISVFGIITQQTNDLTPVEHGRSAISVEITQTKNTVIKQAKVSPVVTPTKQFKPETTKTNHKPAPVMKHISTDSSNSLNTSKKITLDNRKNPEPFKKANKDVKLRFPTDNSTPDKHAEVNTEIIIAVLQKELSKHFYYPQSAQRKNWEGLVILSFTIMPNGVINKIEINKSSGYDVLDDAAIEALQEVKKHEELSLALNGNSHEQLLPVNYRLTN